VVPPPAERSVLAMEVQSADAEIEGGGLIGFPCEGRREALLRSVEH